MDRKKIKIKNLIGLVDNPTYEDLLFEICDFLESEKRMDGEFSKWDVSMKTRCRIKEEIKEDLQELCNLGYIKHLKYTRYKVIKHPWEIPLP
jgi:hypothetical protein